jgi:hypothetical protein
MFSNYAARSLLNAKTMNNAYKWSVIKYLLYIVRGVLESSWTVIFVTASVKGDERGGKVMLSQAYCISLPCDTVL